MGIFNKLSDRDVELITSYVDWFGIEDGNSRTSIEKYLSEWSKQKESWYHLFGDKFILEKAIQVPANSYTFGKNMYWELRKSNPHADKARKFQDNFNHVLYEEYRSDNLDYETRIWLEDLLHSDTLFSNVIPSDQIVTIKGTRIVLHKGEKLFRALKKIVLAMNMDVSEYEEYRILHSIAIEKAGAKGTLCLSIHPLDFMTMSDNTYNWSSCMSWRDGGSYRGGTMEEMNAPNTIVAYLKGADVMDWDCGNYTWNSKRWRCLYYTDDVLITDIMAYPFSSEYIDQVVRDWLKELKADNTYPEEISINSSGSDEEGTIMFDGSTNYMYNDFERISHKIFFNRKKYDIKVNSWGHYRFNYGGKLLCLGCGQPIDECVDGTLYGECCSQNYWGTCCNCGCVIESEDDAYYSESGDMYCQDCYSEYFTYDDVWDMDIPVDEAITVHLINDKNEIIFEFTTNEHDFRGCNTQYTSDGNLMVVRLQDLTKEIFLRLAHQITYDFSHDAYIIRQMGWNRWCDNEDEKIKREKQFEEAAFTLFNKASDYINNDYHTHHRYIQTVTIDDEEFEPFEESVFAKSKNF